MKATRKRNQKVRRTRLSPGRRSATPRGRAMRPSRMVLLPRLAPPQTPLVAEPAPERTEAARGDNLQLYLREVGQLKMITPAEEIVLAKRIKRGDAAAREEMIKANLRLVVKIARDYEGLGLPLLDLINEGNIGLMKGVERFRPDKGAKLSTYASWWIKQAVKRALANQSKTIRLPIHVVDKVAHIRRADVKLREALDREPTDEEVADQLGMHPRQVKRYRDASRAPVSLDAPVGEDDATRVSEVVPDPGAAAPFEQLVRDSDFGLVREVLETLDPRERKILRLRFGLEDDSPMTLEEVGEHFRLTRERIRQIQEEALLKLRKAMERRDRPAADKPTALAA